MLQETLIPGFEFATKHNLTHKETILLLQFLGRPYTCAELSINLEKSTTSLYHTIQRLRLKKLLILKDRDSEGNNIYQFNLEILD